MLRAVLNLKNLTTSVANCQKTPLPYNTARNVIVNGDNKCIFIFILLNGT